MPRSAKPVETTLQIWGVPERLKVKFKMRCAKKKQTMREAILQLMASYIKS